MEVKCLATRHGQKNAEPKKWRMEFDDLSVNNLVFFWAEDVVTYTTINKCDFPPKNRDNYANNDL